MPVDLGALLSDLADESADFYRLLSRPDWERETPSAGWTVHDQVSHLAFFDDLATLAAAHPDEFRAHRAILTAQGPDIPAQVAPGLRGLPGPETLAWLRRSRTRYLAVFAEQDPKATLPWFGPPMSVASSVTARLMETWAHGQDVADALGMARTPTARLRHIAHLGVRTLEWSFQVHDRPPPDRRVRVELTAPDTTTWTWGPAEADDRVSGPAEDFCLVVTQRRHRADTALQTTGPLAAAWLDIAQAYAGPPGSGRPPS